MVQCGHVPRAFFGAMLVAMDAQNAGGLLQLDLPEHGRIELPVAGVGRRLAAALIDMILMVAVGVAAAIVTLVAAGGRLINFDIAMGVLAVTAGLMPVAGPLVFEVAWRGQTPGKRLLALRVLSRDGSPASRGQLFLRNILRLVDFLPVGYFVALVSMFISEHGQRLGDLVAGTVVIREDAGGLAEAGVEAPGPRTADLHGLPESLVRAARLLNDPTRQLRAELKDERRAEILAMARRHRPDMQHESDDAVWNRLVQGGGV